MDNNQAVLFNMKFKASIKKLEELLAAREIDNAIMLLDKMQKEANKIGIDTLDSFVQKLSSIQENSLKKIETRKEEFHALHTKILRASEAILSNRFEDEADKKECIGVLNVHLGMAHYSNDAKAYRDALIAFRDWFKDVDEWLVQLLEDKNQAELVTFVEELKSRAQTIQAKEVLYFVSLFNQIMTEEKSQFKLLLDSYQKSINL
ncbi:MAG: hypothetical protein JXQ76_01380 [Campylobacterales bacterium]|nr:hypothetical protein [Campylobacterales bacterium]